MIPAEYPDKLNKEYLYTIDNNPSIILDGYYYGKENKKYKKGRRELKNNYQKIYLCDFWLDAFCWQDTKSFYHVPDTRVLGLIEKYYDLDIPLGCFIIAVKHRKEKHIMNIDNNGFDLIFKKKAFFEYLEMYDKD